jgi:hypothetical protein
VAPTSWGYSRPNLIRSHAPRLPGRRPSSAVHLFGLKKWCFSNNRRGSKLNHDITMSRFTTVVNFCFEPSARCLLLPLETVQASHMLPTMPPANWQQSRFLATLPSPTTPFLFSSETCPYPLISPGTRGPQRLCRSKLNATDGLSTPDFYCIVLHVKNDLHKPIFAGGHPVCHPQHSVTVPPRLCLRPLGPGPPTRPVPHPFLPILLFAGGFTKGGRGTE